MQYIVHVHNNLTHMIVCFYCSAQSRLKLDRRRLEAAHFKYAILKITCWYADKMESKVIFSPDLNETLLQFIPLYQHLFHTKYSGIYTCTCIHIHTLCITPLTQLIVVIPVDVELFLFWMETKKITVLYVQQVMQVT